MDLLDIIRDHLSYIVFITLVFLLLLMLGLGFLIGMRWEKRSGLHAAAYRDPLTNGLNQAGFRVEYDKLLNRNPNLQAALVLLNIEHFKLINQRYGTGMGDAVLRLVYEALAHCLHHGEIVARGDADCFFLLLCTNDRETIQARIHTMKEMINERASVLHVTVKMRQGVCRVEGLQYELTLLQDCARLALRQFESGKDCVFYKDELMEEIQREALLNSAFEESLSRHDFLLYLQPKVSLEKTICESAEALVRWLHPQLGMIYPSEFIPVFEKNGNILALDRYMFEEVCSYLHQRKERGCARLSISINLSRQNFQNLSFLQDFASIKTAYGIENGQIELELTESVFFDQKRIELVKQAVVQMHELGFRCSLDDFGAGFSSLGLLKSFDVDAIKLDRIFFENIAQEKAQSILYCLIELAHRLKVCIVAEGVETNEQLEFLQRADCDLVQGYYFSCPLPIERFEEWLLQFHD